jgi:hypothetical protein
MNIFLYTEDISLFSNNITKQFSIELFQQFFYPTLSSNIAGKVDGKIKGKSRGKLLSTFGFFFNINSLFVGIKDN